MDFNSRLNNLRERRAPSNFNLDSTNAQFRKSFESINEAFDRAPETPSIKYVIGAMEEVDSKYTEKSYSEGERVKKQIEQRVSRRNPVIFEYQGSVPLNIHIKGVSDIDILVLRSDFVTNDTPIATNTYFECSHLYSANEELSILRTDLETLIPKAFWGAKIDIEGSKSIAISEGSLARKIDIVPSHWHDTIDYQRSKLRHDRGIYVYNKKENARVYNHPFLHMKKIDEKDSNSFGNAKRLIRFLKNLKADSDKKINLSSYDIASLIYHMAGIEKFVSKQNLLILLPKLDLYLASLSANEEITRSLVVPDGSRKIIDSESKLESIRTLGSEVDALLKQIASDISRQNVTTWREAHQILSDRTVNF